MENIETQLQRMTQVANIRLRMLQIDNDTALCQQLSFDGYIVYSFEDTNFETWLTIGEILQTHLGWYMRVSKSFGSNYYYVKL